MFTAKDALDLTMKTRCLATTRAIADVEAAVRRQAEAGNRSCRTTALLGNADAERIMCNDPRGYSIDFVDAPRTLNTATGPIPNFEAGMHHIVRW